MEDDNCLALIKELCASFLAENQITNFTEHNLATLVKSTLSNIFIKYKKDPKDVGDGYSLLRTEIIARIIASGSKYEDHAEEIRKYLCAIEEMYEDSDEKEELNSMFLFLNKLSQVHDFTCNVPQTDDSPVSFFGGSFNGSNWNIFHRDPGPICPAFNFPFYEPPGTGIKLIQDHCPSFEPLSNDFSKFYDGKCKLYRFDLNRPVESTSQDEGFVTPGSEFSNETDVSALSFSSAMSTSSSLDELEFDSQALKLCKKTWEQLGSEAYYPELPFASEHPESIIPLWKIFNASQNLRNKTFSLDDRVRCDFEQLKCDLQYLLFGMNSSSFFYSCITKSFYIRDKLHLKTLTPEIVADMCKPFLECAAFYHALKTFVEERRILPFGPTHQVYCSSLLEILNVYRYSILNLNWTDIRYAVQLDSIIMPFQRKLQFLTKFCLINFGEDSDGFNFPSGVQLLDYLYSNLMKVFRSDFSCILIHLFEKCCNMYLKIVSEWIFDGSFSNPANYAEFFIEIQQEDELSRDWRRVSCIKLKEKRVPTFLEKFYKDVFLCGKSVNLLKIFTRRDVFDTLLRKDYPSMKCCFNKNQLKDYVVVWQEFQLANDSQFNSQKKIRETFFKTYGPEFYANIQRVRKEWFTNYENRLKPQNVLEEKSMEKHHEVTEETFQGENSENKTCVEVPKKKIEEVEGDVKETEKVNGTDEKPDELEVSQNGTVDEITKSANADEHETKYEVKSSTEVQEEKPKLKTKKLVEFYEQLNLSSTSPEKSPRHSPRTPVHSPRPIIFDRKVENKNNVGETNSLVAEKIAISVTSPSDPLLESVSPSPFSDYKGGSSGSRMKTSTPAAKSVDRAKKTTKFSDTGGGDFISPLGNSSVTSRIVGASGDAPSQTSVEADTSKIPVQLSDLQRNRLRSIYSDHQNQLNVTNEICVEKKIDSTPLNTRQQNRLKSMSSDCLNQMGSGDAVCEKKSLTPLSVRDQNKLKVMSSEYHQRLSTRETSKSETSLSAARPARELSEYERNRKKIMSSEYHLRLLDCVNHDERVQEKLTTKTTSKLTEYQRNKLKVMATEFDFQPKSLPIIPLQTPRSLEKENEKLTSHHETSSSTSSGIDTEKSLFCTPNADDDAIEESETFSEDVESEDQVTVVENIGQHLPSLPMESLKNELNDETASSDVFRSIHGLNLQTYISYGPLAFAGQESRSENCLQTAAQSVHDVDRTSILYYLSQSIRIPLRVQTKIVNDAILRVFIEEEGYLEHLTTLRNYLLLRKSEFCILLTNTMFKMAEQVKKPYLLLNNYSLSCLLQQALLAGNARESIRFERKLYFVVDDVIPQAFDLQDIKALKCVSLNYAVKWPINVLITEAIIKKYSRIFKFLMQIQLALWTLKCDFKGLKNLKRGKSSQYTLIQIYRHSMTQVVRILHEYVMREGIERCWNELVEYLSNSEITLDGLYLSHLKYINKVMQRCFLCEQSATCHESVLNLLSSVLQYHAALRSGTWHRNVQVNFLYHTNFKNIQETFEQYQQHLNEVRSKLESLVYSKQRLYFEPLLVELSR